MLRILLVSLLCPIAVHAQDHARTFPWRFVKVAVLETDNPDALVREFRTATIDSNGVVTVLDRMSGNRSGGDPFLGFHQFGPDGRWIRNLSREGEGPGEFRSPTWINAAADGSLVIIDGSKVTRVTKDCQYLHSFRIAPSNYFGIRLFEDYCWIVRLRTPSNDPTSANTQVFELYDQEGHMIWNQSFSGIQYRLLYYNPVHNSFVGITNPCVRQVLWDIDQDGQMWLIPPEYNELWCVNLDNGVKRQQIHLPALDIDRDQWRAMIEERISTYLDYDQPIYREAAQRIRSTLRRSEDNVAPGQRMWAVRSEGFLIDRIPVDDFLRNWWDEPGRYIALFRDGTASIETEGPGGIVVCEHGYVLCRHSDRDDLPRLVLYRLEDSGGY